jgi:hypothetical protein
MPRKNRKMENERMDRVQSPGSHGDMRAGDEGVDDPAMSRSHRDDMSATPMHGDRLGEGRTDMNEDQGSSNRMESQRSRRTGGRANDEQFDNAAGFSGQGAQKEGAMEEAEGTGYTDDASNTSRNRRENPLS